MNTTRQIFFTGPGFFDSKTTVGTNYLYSTIDGYISALSSLNALEEGMLVNDSTNNVTWQVYKDGSNWEARLFDGRFHVKAMVLTPPVNGSMEIEGSVTSDGILCSEGDIVLLTGAFPNLNGIWIVHESTPWVRHEIFDEAIDNIRAISFIVDNGNVYKNSEWRFITIGDITPATLNSDYTLFISNPTLFFSYTWLFFDMVGRQHPVLSATASGTLWFYDYVAKADASSGNMILGAAVYQLIPYQEYFVTKTDSSSNKVSVLSDDSFDQWVLLYENDWVKFIVGDAKASGYDAILFWSNRINKLLLPSTISADGKLDKSVPSGWRVWQIKGYVSTGGTADAVLNLGKTSGASDIISAETYNDNGTVVVSDIDDNTITDIWVSEYSSGDWNGNTLTFEILIVKE